MNEKLRQARLARRWSTEMAAERIGVSRLTFLRWEKDLQTPHLSTLNMVCDAFKMSPEELGFSTEKSASCATSRQKQETALESASSASPQTVTSVAPETDAMPFQETLASSHDGKTPQCAILLVSLSPSASDVPPSENASTDCATWLSEKLTYILVLITQRQRRLSIPDMQSTLDRELRGFDDMKTLFDPDASSLSRRSALLVIAALPKGLLDLLQQQNSLLIEEEFLPACAASVTACWHLLNAGDYDAVERALARFLPFLVESARQAFPFQKTAAHLAAQSFLLLGLVALHRVQLQQRTASCEKAVLYAQCAEDPLLLVEALVHLGDARYYQRQYAGMLSAEQQAMSILQETAITFPRVLQSRVLMGLAHAYAPQGNRAEALDAIGKARTVFSGEIEDLPIFLSASTGPFSLILYEGWVRLDLGKHDPQKEHYEQAAQTFAQIEALPKTLYVPERFGIEITNRRGQAAIGLGDLDAFRHYTLQSVEGLKSVHSEKRRQELIENYKIARKKWPYESQVQDLAEFLL
jgi:transcriptional regulator with XRE-family HTH domain/tetratricopeptide (TPR) repeat protein